MIFMPGSRPDGLCRLLAEGIEAFGDIPVIYGVILDYQAAARVCRDRQAAVMVGVPAQIRRLALAAPDLRQAAAGGRAGMRRGNAGEEGNAGAPGYLSGGSA